MVVEAVLELSKPSFLIIEEGASKRIVIGVPHHAPAGTAQLPCPEHTDADENAGYLGRYVAEKLHCCSVIACNYTIDVNKFLHSDYTMQIAKWNPQVLVEIHGHGGKTARNDIEISSGCGEHDRYSEPLAEHIRASFSNVPDLRDVTVCGTFSKLYFKASSSVTITGGRWISYHIELPPKLRRSSGTATGKPPPLGYHFCDALIGAMRDLHGF